MGGAVSRIAIAGFCKEAAPHQVRNDRPTAAAPLPTARADTVIGTRLGLAKRWTDREAVCARAAQLVWVEELAITDVIDNLCS
jgi:hypothetical protein